MTTMPGPICYRCKHFARKPNSRGAAMPFHCAAFPERIPQAIITSQADHRKPYDGDLGVQFEARDAEGDAYAAMIFDRRVPKRRAPSDDVVIRVSLPPIGEEET